MGRNRKLKAQRRWHGLQASASEVQGTEHLWERKIKQELAKEMMREHLSLRKEELGIDKAEKQAFLFFDSSGHTWEEHV